MACEAGVLKNYGGQQPLAEAILFSDESKRLSLIRVSLAGDTLKIDFSHVSRVKKTVDA